jgi:hypothetical protein
MTKEQTPLIPLIHWLFEANPTIKAIRKEASLGAVEIITQNNIIEGIQLIWDVATYRSTLPDGPISHNKGQSS